MKVPTHKECVEGCMPTVEMLRAHGKKISCIDREAFVELYLVLKIAEEAESICQSRQRDLDNNRFSKSERKSRLMCKQQRDAYRALAHDMKELYNMLWMLCDEKKYTFVWRLIKEHKLRKAANNGDAEQACSELRSMTKDMLAKSLDFKKKVLDGHDEMEDDTDTAIAKDEAYDGIRRAEGRDIYDETEIESDEADTKAPTIEPKNRGRGDSTHDDPNGNRNL